MIKKRLSPNQLAEVKANFAGLKQISGYSPLNAEYKVGAIEAIETALDALLLQEAQVAANLADLRDQIAEKGTEFQQKIKGATQQVVAQFGDDSTEYQSLGRKRASDRAKGRPKTVNSAPKG